MSKMNKIEKLIAELCPDGVEFKSIQVLLDKKIISIIRPPKKLAKKYHEYIGNFPIVDQGKNFIVGYTNDKNVIVDNGKYIVFGDHTEAIKYVDFPFAQGADGIKILKTNGILVKYFYYSLHNFYKRTGKYTRHFNFLKKTIIPIPPLDIQKEIVKILDNFTKLEAELEAELEARRKQYEYYREELLSFGDEVEFKKLGEVALYVRGVTYKKSDESPKGMIKVLRGNNITLCSNIINFDDVKKISEIVRVCDNQWLRANDILISVASGSKAHVGKVAYIKKDIDYCFGSFMAVIRTKAKVNSRFLFHLLIGNTFSNYLNMALSTSTINNLNTIIMNAFTIPIPSLSEQKRVVSILDKFDALVNDISTGLPAEIKARRKQYEYYRNKLLTFKPLEKQNVN